MDDATIERIASQHFDDHKVTKVQRLTGGVSADVFRVDLISRAAVEQSIVLRVHGEHHSGHPAQIEFDLLRALQQSGLPVAEPLHLNTRGDLVPYPYLTMRFVAGTSDFPHDAPHAYIEAMAAMLLRIHNTPTHGLPALPVRHEPLPELLDYLPQDLPGESRWRAARKMLTGLNGGAYEGPDQLLHGDFWPANVLWRGNEVAAILDWEDAAIGDPLSDVAGCGLELRYLLGADGMARFTEAYAAQAPVDLQRLALWRAYVAAAAQHFMSNWRLPAEREAHMRSQAMATLSEAVDALR